MGRGKRIETRSRQLPLSDSLGDRRTPQLLATALADQKVDYEEAVKEHVVTLSFTAPVSVEVDLGTGMVSFGLDGPWDASKPSFLHLVGAEEVVDPDGLLDQDDERALDDKRAVRAEEILAVYDGNDHSWGWWREPTAKGQEALAQFSMKVKPAPGGAQGKVMLTFEALLDAQVNSLTDEVRVGLGAVLDASEPMELENDEHVEVDGRAWRDEDRDLVCAALELLEGSSWQDRVIETVNAALEGIVLRAEVPQGSHQRLGVRVPVS